ncbi:hypothetical protein [Mesorhizobium sp. ANAO-SY3R2]|uniref:hypothetical protein n=1 Tax=Mesorhizobium sp. ANAO-SY3R2 TaxID=3166644 RepID=UPI003672099E
MKEAKRHPSERLRASMLYVERWTNAKAALIGFRTGQGHTAVAIAEMLADGTSSDSIRCMWRKWRLPIDRTGGRQRGQVPVILTAHQRKLLAKHARRLGLNPEEYLRRVASVAIEDNLYAAVTDGKFD